MEPISKVDIDVNLGKLLREYRDKSKLTQDELSEQLDISLKYISRIENGKGGIKTQTLIKCINVLGIEPNALYKSFITNPSLKKTLELSEKINSLSDEKKILISSIIDLLQDF